MITPMIRNNICLNAHPRGCAEEVRSQVARVAPLAAKRAGMPRANEQSPKHVLVIGCSTGYGLASRIVAGFAYGAPTVGFSLEKEPSFNKTASAGWYANAAFDREASARGIFSKTFNIDAFSHEAKELAVRTAREQGFKYDLVIYSLASPVRLDPDTGIMYRSAIKPIGRDYTGKTADVFTFRLSEAHVQPADAKEIAETVKVMGGEDWELWLRKLAEASVLEEDALTLAYSYIGPPLSWPIYRDGSIGRAKEDLERAARGICLEHRNLRVSAFVSINKAVVTRASAVIPIIPLYVSTLFKVMKERNIHEDCLDQMLRLFSERLYMGKGNRIPLDAEGRIRLDELEMGAAVQEEVLARMSKIDEGNLAELTDIEGFRKDFLRVHGFDVPGVEYSQEVDPLQ